MTAVVCFVVVSRFGCTLPRQQSARARLVRGLVLASKDAAPQVMCAASPLCCSALV